jgi:hypothetical protein
MGLVAGALPLIAPYGRRIRFDSVNALGGARRMAGDRAELQNTSDARLTG